MLFLKIHVHTELARSKIFPYQHFLFWLFRFMNLIDFKPKLFSDSFQLIISICINPSFRSDVISCYLIELWNRLTIIIECTIENGLIKVLSEGVEHVFDLDVFVLSALLIDANQHHLFDQVSYHLLLFLCWFPETIEGIISYAFDGWQFSEVEHFPLCASVWY